MRASAISPKREKRSLRAGASVSGARPATKIEAELFTELA